MGIEPTLTIGELFETASVLLGGIGIFFTMRAQLKFHADEIGEIKTELKEINKTINIISVQRVQIETANAEITGLKLELRAMQADLGRLYRASPA